MRLNPEKNSSPSPLSLSVAACAAPSLVAQSAHARLGAMTTIAVVDKGRAEAVTARAADMQGAFPLQIDGQAIGAIGVGGETHEEGLAALEH